jgi:hypothetical protein
MGVGTEADPFRVDVSCFQMLHNYLEVQGDVNMTTVVHVDTTFKLVRQRYPVAVVGYSDNGSHFYPIAYFCTSRRAAPDVAWCIRAVKQATEQAFGRSFEPEFVMMDGDNAQYNACSDELPSTAIGITSWITSSSKRKLEMLSRR